MHTSLLAELLLNHQKSFHPVLPFDPARQKLVAFDFTEKNHQMTTEILNNTQLFCNYIDQQLSQYQATYGIGGYAEHRTIYSRSRLFDGTQGEEPRRFHLGIDVWGKVGTPLYAPLDSTVHSFAFNDRAGDYGATLILAHELEQITFYTLYGHLSLDSIRNKTKNDIIRKGELIASLGIPAENGHWPPHLHFQLIKNMQGWDGDYPGVCKFSEREMYLNNCPDADLVLQMNQFVEVRDYKYEVH